MKLHFPALDPAQAQLLQGLVLQLLNCFCVNILFWFGHTIGMKLLLYDEVSLQKHLNNVI